MRNSKSPGLINQGRRIAEASLALPDSSMVVPVRNLPPDIWSAGYTPSHTIKTSVCNDPLRLPFAPSPAQEVGDASYYEVCAHCQPYSQGAYV